MKKVIVFFTLFSFLVTGSLGTSLTAFAGDPPKKTSTTDPKTGITTTVEIQHDGARTEAKTDKDGREIGHSETKPMGAVDKRPIREEVDKKTGERTTVWADGKGGEILVHTSGSGRYIGS
ncbi:hypothetical protein ACFL4E_02985, partial [Candidatus Omnitrophota bacterium]